MGVRYGALVEQKQTIAKIKAEIAPIEAAKIKEQAVEAAIDKEICELAVPAAGGNRSALRRQTELRIRKDECHQQIINIEALAVPKRLALADAEAKLPALISDELCERIADGIRELPKMVEELSKMIQPIAKAFGEFRSRIDVVTGEVLPIIARGDPERIRTLENRLRTMIVRGIRAQLSFDFRCEGLDLLSVSEFEGKNFQCVVEPLLASMISAVEMNLHTNDVVAADRRQFRCLTRISQLFGVNLLPGEIVSLPVGHEIVKKLISQRALEIVESPSENTKEER
jgi:hypothetical protein